MPPMSYFCAAFVVRCLQAFGVPAMAFPYMKHLITKPGITRNEISYFKKDRRIFRQHF
jgi:hypothetical protein